MATQLSQLGLEIDKVDTGDIPTGGTDKVLLYASGSGSDTKLYVKSGANTQKQLGVDIDQYDELDAAPHATQDEFLVSDNGTEKRVSMTNLALGVFAVASDAGDVSYGSDGELTIAATSVTNAMLAGSIADSKLNAISSANKVEASALELSSNTAMEDDAGLALKANIAGDGLAIAESGGNQILSVGVDDSSLEIDSDALRVKASGVTNAMLAGSIANAKLANSTISGVALGSNLNALAVDDSSIEYSAGSAFNGSAASTIRVKASGVTNAMLAGSIANAKLANDSVTVGSTEINLGASSTVLAGITQLTASNIQVTNLDVVTLNSVSQTETTLEVADKLIVAALSASSANSDGGGLKIGGGQNSAGNASVLYDHNSGTPQLDFNMGGTTQIKLRDGVLMPETDSDVDLGTTAARFKDAFVDSITVTGEVDAASLDISGDADIDGTLEADAITVNGVSLQVVVEDHVGAMLDGTETGISVSYDATDNNLDFVIDAAQTAITSILATDLKIGEDDQTKIDFETADEIHFYAANAEQVYVADGVFGPQTDSDVELGADGVAFKKLYVDDIDLNGQGRIDLDADADTSIRSSADDQIDFELGGSDLVAMKATGIHLVDDKKMVFGNGDDASIEFDADGTSELRFAGAAVTFEQAVSFDGNLTLGNASTDVTTAASQVTASAGLLVANHPLYVQSNVITDAAGLAMIFSQAGGNHASTSFRGAITGQSGYSSGDFAITTDGSGSFAGDLIVGRDGQHAGGDATFFGDQAGEKAYYSGENNIIQVTGSAASGLRVNIGGNATSEYAVDVANGSNNNNKMRAAAFVTYSDESLKSDVQSMNTALDTVMSLNGVEFTWKDSGERDFGFIAQDVQSVLPKAVHTADDGVQGVDYSRLTSVLVEAVKAQQVQIEELKALLKK